MGLMIRKFTILRCEQRGATAIEYGLIASLLAVFLIGAIGSTGLNVEGLYSTAINEIGGNINNANNANNGNIP